MIHTTRQSHNGPAPASGMRLVSKTSLRSVARSHRVRSINFRYASGRAASTGRIGAGMNVTVSFTSKQSPGAAFAVIRSAHLAVVHSVFGVRVSLYQNIIRRCGDSKKTDESGPLFISPKPQCQRQ